MKYVKGILCILIIIMMLCMTAAATVNGQQAPVPDYTGFASTLDWEAILSDRGEGMISYTASVPDLGEDAYHFDSDDSFLLVTRFRVAEPGEASITNVVRNLACADDYMTPIITKYVVKNSNFTFNSSFTAPGEEADITPVTSDEKATVTVYGIDGQADDTRDFAVGDEFTVYTTLNCSRIYPYIGALTGMQYFTMPTIKNINEKATTSGGVSITNKAELMPSAVDPDTGRSIGTVTAAFSPLTLRPGSIPVEGIEWKDPESGSVESTSNGELIIAESNKVPSCNYGGTVKYTISAQGYSTASKTMTATVSPKHDLDHFAEVPGHRTENGCKEHYRCNICGKYFDASGGETTQDDLVIPATGEYFPRHSLTLKGNIDVNFYVDLTDEELAQGAAVSFVCNNKTYEHTVTADDYNAEVGLYRTSCDVSAAEMTDAVHASLTIGDTQVDTDEYSVRQYADTILAGDYTDEVKTLVKTMLCYGAKAQSEFEHNTNDLADEGIDYTLVDLTQEEINALPGTLPKRIDNIEALGAYGVKYYGCSLLLRSKTTLRFYFEKTGTGAYSTENFTINGQTTAVKPYGNGERYVYIEIENIPAPDLDDSYSIKVGDVDLGDISPLTYAKGELIDHTSETLTELMNALCRYHEAAKALWS